MSADPALRPGEQLLEREQRVRAPLESTFTIYSDASNLEAITPPWLGFRITSQLPIEMREGALISYRLVVHRIPVRWTTRIEAWEPPHRFVDVQLRGPYALWHHTHEFERDGDWTVIRDRVRYRIGYGSLGSLAQRFFVFRDLEKIFDYRRRATAELIAREANRGRLARSPAT